MAFPMIETGYKPEFSLGALYQGENAAAAQNMQTQEIIKQALENIQKQVSFPIEMENKQALSNQYNAMAEKMRREPQETNAERIAKADAVKRLTQNRDARGYLETAMNMPEGRNEFLSRLIETGVLPDQVKQRLRPQPNMDLYTNDNINSIIRGLRETDPEAGKVMRQEMGDSTRIQIAEMNNDARSKLQALKDFVKKDKIATSFEQQGNTYYQLAEQEQDPDKKANLLKQAHYFYNLALQKAEQGALARNAGAIDLGKEADVATRPEPPKAPTPPNMPTNNNDPLGIR